MEIIKNAAVITSHVTSSGLVSPVNYQLTTEKFSAAEWNPSVYFSMNRFLENWPSEASTQ